MPIADQRMILGFEKMVKAIMRAKYSHELPPLEERKGKFDSFRHYLKVMEEFDMERNNGKKT